MVEMSDSLRLLFETSLEDDGDRYVVPIPDELVENGSVSVDESYRIALLTTADAADRSNGAVESARDSTGTGNGSAETELSGTTSPTSDRQMQGPPVEEGEVRSVTIDTLGDQGDGIAKVERGFIVIVSGTQPGDQVDVEITDVKDTVAFAEPVSDPTVR